jgi:hypothetical protein
MDNVVRKNMTTCPVLQHVFFYKHVVSLIEMHRIFVNTIMQKINTNKKRMLPVFGFNLCPQIKTRGIWYANNTFYSPPIDHNFAQ